jgi:hypothetical protein
MVTIAKYGKKDKQRRKYKFTNDNALSIAKNIH